MPGVKREFTELVKMFEDQCKKQSEMANAIQALSKKFKNSPAEKALSSSESESDDDDNDVGNLLEGDEQGKLKHSEDVDLVDIVEKITDIGKMAAEASFKETKSRRACLEPRFKSIRDILKETISDEYIFGKSLEEKLKKVKDSEKLVKLSVLDKEKRPSGNFRHSQGPRPPPNGHNYTNANAFPRQRISFRGSNFRRGQSRGQFNAGQREQREYNKQ